MTILKKPLEITTQKSSGSTSMYMVIRKFLLLVNHFTLNFDPGSRWSQKIHQVFRSAPNLTSIHDKKGKACAKAQSERKTKIAQSCAEDRSRKGAGVARCGLSKMNRVIQPAEVRRTDFESIECPVCGERFVSDH
jgi:hypothetical protein